jgi:heme exporter protein CcmD
MIEGGWEFIWPAYGLALGSLAVLAIVVVVRLRAWERRARELEKKP